MFCLTLFEGLLFLGKQKVVSSHFFHNWLLFVCLWQKCTCSLYGTVVRQFVLNEMGWSILRISAGLDLNHARWHVSIRDNKLIHTSHNLCGSVPISGLNIIKTFLKLYKRPGSSERTEDRNIARIPGLMLGPVRDPLWSLHWWTITILHRPDTRAPDYQLPSIGLPAHAPSWPVTCHTPCHPIKPFHTRTTLWCIGGLWNNNWQRCKTKPGSNVPKRVFIHERN